MRQTSVVKRTTVKTPAPATVTAPTAVATPKKRVEIPSPKTACSKEDFNKKVAEKAYDLFLKRNGGPGSAEDDWIQAEKIVKAS